MMLSKPDDDPVNMTSITALINAKFEELSHSARQQVRNKQIALLSKASPQEKIDMLIAMNMPADDVVTWLIEIQLESMPFAHSIAQGEDSNLICSLMSLIEKQPPECRVRIFTARDVKGNTFGHYLMSETRKRCIDRIEFEHIQRFFNSLDDLSELARTTILEAISALVPKHQLDVLNSYLNLLKQLSLDQ